MAHENAKVNRVFGLLLLALTLVMTVSVVVLLAQGSRFTPVMLAPALFLGIGILMYRSGRNFK
ncbi:hypothetical protein [Streptomyces rubiginosohelvolus]|uniref:hypothetical protein n=1 Tax=Streptomyces rubiginosohelvolus TaxID=67362 RepID=UPI0036845A54